MDGVLGDNFNQVAETLVTNWSTEEAQGQMEDWLNAHSVEEIEALDLIVTHDDEIVDGIMNALDAYSGEATINVNSSRPWAAAKRRCRNLSTQLGVKFWTSFFSPSFIRDAFELGIGDLIGEPYTAEQDENGTYLIPPSPSPMQTWPAMKTLKAIAPATRTHALCHQRVIGCM